MARTRAIEDEIKHLAETAHDLRMMRCPLLAGLFENDLRELVSKMGV